MVMQIPKRPTAPIKHSIPGAPGVVFTLKPLSNAQFDEVTDLITSEKKATGLTLACKFSLTGWEGFEDEFSVDSVAVLPHDWRYELGGKAVEISSLTETEKN